MAFPTLALSDYLQATADLLHVEGSGYGYWGSAKLTRFINDAMQKRDVLTGGVRTLVTVPLVAGTDSYTFTNTSGLARAFDVNAITLIYGSTRVLLGQLPFTELTRDFRIWTNLQSTPIAWAKLNAFTVYVAPAPSQAFSTIWDVSSYSTALANLTDTDALPYPYTEPIPYYAAYRAKIDERQYDESAWFEEQFQKKINEAINAKTGVVPNYYAMQR